MRFLFIFLTWVSVFGPSAGADLCQHRIFFLPQTHEVAGIPNVDDKSYEDETAISQLKVANYLDRFPQLPVFSEQATHEDLSADQIPANMMPKVKAMIDGVFPRGVGLDPQQLNALQKHKLIINGGEVVQMMRGQLQVIHRVLEDKQADDRIFGPIIEWYKTHGKGTPYPPEIARLIYGARERAALEQVDKLIQQNPKQRDVILIFGSNHNFSFYPDLFPPQCVVVPPEFQEDWIGQYRVGPEGFSDEVMKTGILPNPRVNR